MKEPRVAMAKNRRPKKKYQNSNCFVDTRLSYKFSLDTMAHGDAVEHAMKQTISGGIFVLLTNHPLTVSETLGICCSRNIVESAFGNLKHGIYWRPAGCTPLDAIRGRVLVSFLALFCISMMRFLYLEFRVKTGESISGGLGSFTLTVERRKDGGTRRMWSNFTPVIGRLKGVNSSWTVEF